MTTTWAAQVGEENARWLATECRTARLASEYRPHDRGGGHVEISALALGALRELGEEEDGYITDDGDGLRIWIGDDAFELEPAQRGPIGGRLTGQMFRVAVNGHLLGMMRAPKDSGYGPAGVGLMVEGLPLAEELSVVYARMSGLLLSEETVTTAVGLVTASATEAIPGAVGAGVTLVDERGCRTTSGASDPVVEKADGMQYELDEGPCLVAWAQRALVRLDDVGSDGRWPRWSRAVEPLGLRAAMSAPLVAGDRSLGALKVYARRPGAFDRHAEHLLVMFAAQAAILLANVQSVETARRLGDGLKDALRSRDVIATAKGILMAREGVAEEQALAMLLACARREHRTLHDAAHALVRTTVRRGH